MTIEQLELKIRDIKGAISASYCHGSMMEGLTHELEADLAIAEKKLRELKENK